MKKSTVSALHVEQAFSGTAEFSMKAEVTDGKESPWNALCIGLRLNRADAQDPG